MSAHPPAPLELSPEEFRRLGYQVVDRLAEHLAHRESQPVWRPSDPAVLEHSLGLPIPDQPRPVGDLLDLFFLEIVPHTIRVTHPRFFGYVPVPGMSVAALADTLASTVNIFSGSWQSGAAAAVIERKTIEWLCCELGMPVGAGGLTVSGGSMANLTALAVALHQCLGGYQPSAIAYFSDQTHSSVERALRVLGFQESQLRHLSTDERGCLILRELEEAVWNDRALGLRPFCVVANAGTTSTGAVDPFVELAEYCAAESLWLHADAAYGGGAVLCERGRKALVGLDRVDSMALDPHKWLFQPMDLGCVLVRRDTDLTETFRILPDYLRDVYRTDENRNYCDRGLELTRPFRAFKLWFALQFYGVAAFREAVGWGFHLCDLAEACLRDDARWEIITPAQMGIVTFRRRGASDEDQLELIDRIRLDGYALLTSTTVAGRTALRLSTINPRTTEADIRSTIGRLGDLLGMEPQPDTADSQFLT